MKKSQNPQDNKNAIGLSSLCNDIFGIKAWEHQKKERNDRQSVPWQWVLWGGLVFFCLGFAIQAESLWVLVAAVAAAVIVFLARSTESVQPQIFLLTDNRSEGEKTAYQNREREKRAQHKPRTRPANTNKETPKAQAQEVTPAVAEVSEVAKPTEPQAKTARRTSPRRAPKSVATADKPAPRRPRAARKPRATAQSALTQAPTDAS